MFNTFNQREQRESAQPPALVQLRWFCGRASANPRQVQLAVKVTF